MPPTSPSDLSGAVCLAVFRPNVTLLERQLESIRSQTLSTWTCTVAIDGTDPQTEAFVHTVVRGDDRFRVIAFDTNVGFYRNFERCLHHAMERRPAWIALSDQDDYWFPHKLERQVEDLRSSSRASLSLASAIVTDGKGSFQGIAVRRPSTLFDSALDNTVTGSFSVFRTDVADLALPFPEPTSVSYHDHWIGLCAAVSGTIVADGTPLQEYVQHGANVIGEAGRSTLSSRGRSFGTPNLFDVVRILRDDRWAWRIRMASSLLDRRAQLDQSSTLVLTAIAEGRLSIRLARYFFDAFRRGRTDRARTLALLIGAIFTWKQREA